MTQISHAVVKRFPQLKRYEFWVEFLQRAISIAIITLIFLSFRDALINAQECSWNVTFNWSYYSQMHPVNLSSVDMYNFSNMEKCVCYEEKVT